MAKHYPRLVGLLVTNFDAWIVGSAANLKCDHPRDWDVLVPFHNWSKAVSCIPIDAKMNSYGGWKFKDGGVEIDVWPGDVGWIMSNPLTEWLWHPASGSRFQRYSNNGD